MTAHRALTGSSSIQDSRRRTGRIARLALLALLVSPPLCPAAAAQEKDGVTLSFEPDAGAFSLSAIEDSTSPSDLSSAERDQIAIIGEEIARLQASSSEGLGLAASLGPNGDIRVQPDFDLDPNDIRVTQDLLWSLRKRNLTYPNLRGPAGEDPSLKALITEKDGVFRSTLTGIEVNTNNFQTIDPGVLGVPKPVREKIRNWCTQYIDVCTGTTPRTMPGNLSSAGGGPSPYRVYPDLLNLIAFGEIMPSAARTACSAARTEFNHYIEQRLNQFDGFGDWQGGSANQEIAAQFDRSCLIKPEAIPPSILSRLAVLRLPGIERPFCTAYQIGPQTFLTARHCFHDRLSGIPVRDRREKAQLFLYRDPGTPIDFIDPTAAEIGTTNLARGSLREIPSQDDYLVLTTEIRFESIVPLELGEPVPGARLVVPGMFLFADPSNRMTDKTTWSQDIRATKDPDGGACKLIDMSVPPDGKQCLVHFCQALPGFSGSPVLQYNPDGSLGLIGVHVRAAGLESHHCPGKFFIGGDSPAVVGGNLASRPILAQ